MGKDGLTCLTTISLTSRLARGGARPALLFVARRLFCQTRYRQFCSIFSLHFCCFWILLSTRGSPLDRFDRSHHLQSRKRSLSRSVSASLLGRSRARWVSSSSPGWFCDRWAPSGDDRRKRGSSGNTATSVVSIEESNSACPLLGLFVLRMPLS